MTREEAIAFFEDMNECTYGSLEAVEMAISALSADGEYIKKEDLFNKTIKRNSIWNGTTNAEGKGLEEIVNDLPTYSFSDSAENKGEWIKLKNGYKCSKCGHIMDKVLSFSGNLIYQYSNYCPECGKRMT